MSDATQKHVKGKTKEKAILRIAGNKYNFLSKNVASVEVF